MMFNFVASLFVKEILEILYFCWLLDLIVFYWYVYHYRTLEKHKEDAIVEGEKIP